MVVINRLTANQQQLANAGHQTLAVSIGQPGFPLIIKGYKIDYLGESVY